MSGLCSGRVTLAPSSTFIFAVCRPIPPHKKIEKTALGAYDYVPWTYWERTTDALKQLAAAGIPIAAVETTDNAVSCFDYDWREPIAVVFGNEVTGINQRVLKRCDTTIQIPMFGYKHTINVATAFGIVLYEILRRWGRVLPGDDS